LLDLRQAATRSATGSSLQCGVSCGFTVFIGFPAQATASEAALSRRFRVRRNNFPACAFAKQGALFRRAVGHKNSIKGPRRQRQRLRGSAMNSFTAIVSILAAAAAVTFAITAYVN
jgi:Zn-dependent M28 family amino/carboxypeptidase